MTATVVITGGDGLLGTALKRAFAAGPEPWNIVAPARGALDVADAAAVEALIAGARPRAVVHSAAMTGVDRCEIEPERAYRSNACGTRAIAGSASRHGARVIAVSTDYVFSGHAARPYREGDPVGPINVYGASKLVGEELCALLCPDHAIARVSWLFGPGGKTFIDSLVTWGRQTDGAGPLRVTADQATVPTSTRSAAAAIRALAASPHRGIVHVTCSGGGCSRFELARAVFDLLALPRPLEPCTMADFDTPARRPHDSRLDNALLAELGIGPLPDWRDELAAYLTATYAP